MNQNEIQKKIVNDNILKFKKDINLVILNRIDKSIEYFLSNFSFNDLEFYGLLNLIGIKKIEKKYLEDIIFYYIYFEIKFYSIKIFLDNPNLINGYFFPNTNIYKYFGEDIILLMYLKLNILINKTTINNRIDKIIKYIEFYYKNKKKIDINISIIDTDYLLKNKYFEKNILSNLKIELLKNLYIDIKRKTRIKFLVGLYFIKYDIEIGINKLSGKYLDNLLLIIEILDKENNDSEEKEECLKINNEYNFFDNKLFKDFLQSL